MFQGQKGTLDLFGLAVQKYTSGLSFPSCTTNVTAPIFHKILKRSDKKIACKYYYCNCLPVEETNRANYVRKSLQLGNNCRFRLSYETWPRTGRPGLAYNATVVAIPQERKELVHHRCCKRAFENRVPIKKKIWSRSVCSVEL